MNFITVIRAVVGDFEKASIDYALIGGFAIALRGIQRATMDLDFILALEDLPASDSILQQYGFRLDYRSENVSHYQSDDSGWGRIDLLHAFRKPSLAMLRRADSVVVAPDLSLRVAAVEDIIGLKIQAACNDPERAADDWNDIRLLVRFSGAEGKPLDWELLDEYLGIFDLRTRMSDLRSWYGTHDSRGT